MREIIAVYADGGCIRSNPSLIGGVWAWCHVNAAGERVKQQFGIIHPLAGVPVSNNLAEFVAVVLALEALPDGWSGKVCSDSQVTLGRLCKGWVLNNLPHEWIDRGSAAIRRLGLLTPVLLQGHPTQADLIRGVGSKRGLPVSKHNVWCDLACQRAGTRYLITPERKEAS